MLSPTVTDEATDWCRPLMALVVLRNPLGPQAVPTTWRPKGHDHRTPTNLEWMHEMCVPSLTDDPTVIGADWRRPLVPMLLLRHPLAVPMT